MSKDINSFKACKARRDAHIPVHFEVTATPLDEIAMEQMRSNGVAGKALTAAVGIAPIAMDRLTPVGMLKPELQKLGYDPDRFSYAVRSM